MDEALLNDIINRLLEVRGRPGKQVQLSESEIRQLCTASRDIFLQQPNLLELEAPIKICDEESWMEISHHHGSFDEQDAAYIGEILKSVQMVADVMEALVKRVFLAESEIAIEKGKVSVCQEEIKRKSTQLENVSVKLEEMERFDLNTNNILNEMRQIVEDLVEETTRQRERAAENEEELSRVKQKFESLKSYVSAIQIY